MSRLIVVTLISLVAAGCTLGPRYKRPEVAAPAAFRGADTSIDPASGSLADLEWPALFNDPALTTIVTSALKQNFDVRIAAERVLQARALYRITRSDQFPQVGASANVVTSGEGAGPPSTTSVTARTLAMVASLVMASLFLLGWMRRRSEG